MRKIISFVLAAVLAVGVLSNAPICKLQLVASAGNVSLDSVTFRLNGDEKSYRVYKCQESAEGDLTIPSTYNGLPVKDIYQNAFSSCKKLSSVTLPESIGTIGAFAFSNCKSLTSVIIPNGVEVIGGFAFDNCSSLASITLPDSLTQIDHYAFSGSAYYNDESNWENDVLYIGNHLIEAKTTVSGVYNIKNGTKTIGESAFSGCSGLTSVKIPSSVKNIGENAFYNTGIYSTESNWENGVLYIDDCLIKAKSTSDSYQTKVGTRIIADDAFDNCTNLRSVVISGSVTNIGNECFSGHSKLINVTIAGGVKEIGRKAFYYCRNLTAVTIPQTVTKIDDFAFGYLDVTELSKVGGFKISGHVGSTAEKYATENGFEFVELKSNHTPSAWITDKSATCTEDGSKHKECTECGEVLETGTITKLGHTSSEWITDKEATCTADGSKHKECTKCGDTLETETIKKFGHNYSSSITRKPTCTESGVKTYICANCKDSYTETVKALGHKSTDWIIDKNATCTEDGSKHKECTVCGDVLAVKIIKSDHISTDWIIDKAATCTNGGTKHKECMVCATTLETEVLTKLGHSSSDWITDKPATCTEVGTKHKECTVCGDTVETGTIAKSGHSASEWITDKSATCTEDGTKHKECTICGDTVETGTIAKSGHSPSEWITDKSATCTEDGTKHKSCTKCGDTLETGTIAKSGHSASEWITDKSATCTEDGIKHRACTKCGDTLETGTITKSGHSPSEWITDKSATCTEDGTKHKSCTKCGDTLETGTIVKLGHTSSNWIVDKKATVNSAGGQHKECTVCGKNLETATIPQLKPTTPKLNSVSNSASGVTVKWSKVSGADSYTVYRKSGSSGWKPIKSGLTGTSYTDTTAKSGTTYTYTVRGVNEAGYGTYNTTGKSITYLSTPKLSSVTNATSGVTIKWGKVTGAKEYYVYRKSGNSGWKKIGTSTGTSYTDKTAKSGTTYTYTVRAYNGKTSSSYNTKGLTIKFLATPKLSSVTSAKSGVTLKWGKVTGASGYYVYRKTGNGSWQKVATVKGNSKVSYLDKSAKKGTTYTYTVRAYNGKTMSAYNTKGLKIKDKY